MDKVQKIREEVARLQKRAEHNFDISLTENERQFWLGESNVLTLIRKYIDTVQEEPQVKESTKTQHINETCKENGDSLTKEPVSEVWHDAQTEQPQAKEKILATNEYGDCEVDFAINMALYWPKVIKWAYIEDLLNLSNVQRTGKNWNEPVSEELEEAAKHYLYSNILYDDVYVGNPTDKDCIEMFKAGANWQIKQLKRGVFIPGAKSVEFKLGEDYHISTKDFDRGKAKAYGAKEGDKIIAYFFVFVCGI